MIISPDVLGIFILLVIISIAIRIFRESLIGKVLSTILYLCFIGLVVYIVLKIYYLLL